MRTVVISDVHLGSRHCHLETFHRFLDSLPEGDTLVLNGDTVDRHHRLPPGHAALLQRLADESRRRPVIWVDGNHDENFRPADPGRITFLPHFAVGRRLYVQHGFYFDRIMPYHRLFILAFRLTHRLRILLGAEPVHVAQYAKRWPHLYAVLRRNVRDNALRFARANGFAAITCGHTHYAETHTAEGIQYLNTGAWTETPVYAVVVDETTVGLHEIDNATGRIDPAPALIVT
jgi:UDP-2,3-diacylglucosamine pyrophosphatase LpxH